MNFLDGLIFREEAICCYELLGFDEFFYKLLVSHFWIFEVLDFLAFAFKIGIEGGKLLDGRDTFLWFGDHLSFFKNYNIVEKMEILII